MNESPDARPPGGATGDRDPFIFGFGGNVIGNVAGGSWAETAFTPEAEGSGVASSVDWAVAVSVLG